MSLKKTNKNKIISKHEIEEVKIKSKQPEVQPFSILNIWPGQFKIEEAKDGKNITGFINKSIGGNQVIFKGDLSSDGNYQGFMHDETTGEVIFSGLFSVDKTKNGVKNKGNLEPLRGFEYKNLLPIRYIDKLKTIYSDVEIEKTPKKEKTPEKKEKVPKYHTSENNLYKLETPEKKSLTENLLNRNTKYEPIVVSDFDKEEEMERERIEKNPEEKEGRIIREKKDKNEKWRQKQKPKEENEEKPKTKIKLKPLKAIIGDTVIDEKYFGKLTSITAFHDLNKDLKGAVSFKPESSGHIIVGFFVFNPTLEEIVFYPAGESANHNYDRLKPAILNLKNNIVEKGYKILSVNEVQNKLTIDIPVNEKTPEMKKIIQARNTSSAKRGFVEAGLADLAIEEGIDTVTKRIKFKEEKIEEEKNVKFDLRDNDKKKRSK